MPRRLVAAITRALRANWDDLGHTHPGTVGRAVVCHDPRCVERRNH